MQNGKSTLLRALLYLPRQLYTFYSLVRHTLYQTGYLKANELESAVISIGNITVGGTGKTPLVEFLARFLTEEGFNVAILTRGYKRKSKARRVLVSDGEQLLATPAEAGDEPYLLARYLPGVAVIVGADRSANARWAQAELDTSVFLLDDGFQHLKLKRDLNLLLIDATDPFGGGELPPFGRLREPLAAMRRAEAVIVTRADRAFNYDALVADLKRLVGEVPLIFTGHIITSLRELATNEAVVPETFARRKVAAFCGLGNPNIFFSDLLYFKLDLAWQKTFPDHYDYTATDLRAIAEAARAAGAEAIITTEKDAVKIEPLLAGELPFYAAQIEVESEDDIKLKSLVLRAVARRQREVRQRKRQMKSTQMS